MKYDDYLIKLSNKIIRRFEDIEAEYNFEFGAEFEIALCSILREFLPEKYGICRGFVVAENGDKEGDDIIIYDQQNFPTLKLNGKNQFLRKESIPIEAVYGYIEAKHSLDINTFTTAKEQIRKVKRLILQRKQVKIAQIDPYLPVVGKFGNNYSYPEYKNPPFTAIFSKNVKIEGKVVTDLNLVELFLNSNKPSFTEKHNPDLIIANSNNGLRPFCELFLVEGVKKEATIFLLEHEKYNYQSIKHKDLAFGLGFIHIISAFNWMRLGIMPYNSMLNDAMLNLE